VRFGCQIIAWVASQKDNAVLQYLVEYALDDVRYLIKNYHQLKIRLENEQKLEWIVVDTALRNFQMIVVF
jgi:ribonuclease D